MGLFFSKEELLRSDYARKHGIDNTPNDVQKRNLARLADELDKIRQSYGAPIRVTSGFRSEALNTALGGSRTSAHMSGLAADLDVGGKAENTRLYNIILAMHKRGDIQFDQLINEYDMSWVHIGFTNATPRGQAFKIK